MSQQPKEEAAPGDASSSPPLDFSGIDFSKPEACLDLKEEHDQCFHVWLAKFVKGEAQTDECKPSWERYRACTAEKLKHHGLSHLQDQWKKPDWADLDTIRRKRWS